MMMIMILRVRVRVRVRVVMTMIVISIVISIVIVILYAIPYLSVSTSIPESMIVSSNDLIVSDSCEQHGNESNTAVPLEEI